MDQDSGVWRWLAEATTDGLWVVDAHGRTLYANQRLAELVGRPREQLEGRLLEEVFSGDQLELLAAHLDRLRAGDARDDVDTRWERPDGSVVWTVASFGPLYDDDGRPAGWWHRVSEHSHCPAHLDRLRVREQQLAAAQRISAIGSWEWNLETGRVEWSDEMYRITGEGRDFEPEVDSFRLRVHPEDLPQFDQAAVDAQGSADSFDTNFRIVLPDGRERWMHGRGMTEWGPDGTPVRARGVVQDITALMEAGEQAEQATRRLNLLQQMAAGANQAGSLDEAVELAAAGLPAYTGWSAVASFAPTPSEGRLEVRQTWNPPVPADPVLAARAAQERAVVVAPGPGPLAETHSVVSIPVLCDGALVRVVQALADESPLDDNSHALIDQVATQLGLVAGREQTARALAQARDAAMEASRLKSAFLATMSHEIRTPMNGVIGLGELLLHTDLDPRQRRLAEGLQTAGTTLMAIINDILDLSKIESGKLELEAADFDVRELFDHTAGILAGPAREKGLELVVACHPEVPRMVRGDATRFGQVVTNLGSNAVKFTDRGQVVVRVELAELTPVEVVLSVEVTDTGVGIPPEVQGRLFDAFTQADASTTRRHGGTGLGLAISQQLAHALGGEVTVHSEPGHGSTFTFTARFERCSGAPGGLSPEATTVPADRRVLVVDDNESNRLALTEQLTAWRLRPHAVGDAEEALAALREGTAAGQPFEVALLDGSMPGTDGAALARVIRHDPYLRGTVLILLSTAPADQGEGAAAGFDLALDKPVRHSELREALRTALGSETDSRAVAGSEPAAARDPVPSAPGGRVLVVEDNEVNQLVASGLLQTLGYAAVVARDGLVALDLLGPGHGFAAVLMDCRMPRLDGFEATRRLRAREADDERVPVIAMTASALEGDRERCLDAGMDDFLTKPVAAVELERVLRRWIPSSSGDDATVADRAAASPTTPAELPVLDHDRVRTLEQLRKDGITFFERTARSFLGRAPDLLRAVSEALSAADHQALGLASHAVKGTALNLGLPRVAAVADRLEALAERSSPTAAGRSGAGDGEHTGAELLAHLEAELDQAVLTLQRELAARS
ncbi:hybrid sensor histidine kinase/response regulator [Nocardioides ferulae]|uniref:hybrid sensor histidine kinase/response regulator n=1 Tax=Nocardioides ferulae TaxID=2340821 RepID=UPI000EB4E26F|nr:hybrid sensor histidine kinase/response regulator [Nocardioides ferulae]